MVFSTRYTPLGLKAFRIIKKYWPFIYRLNRFKNKTIPPPLLAYKSNKNLKSFFVRAKLPSLDRNSETELPSDLSLEFTPIPSSNMED